MKEAIDMFRVAIEIQLKYSSEMPAILKVLSFTYEDTKDFDKAKRMKEYCANRRKLEESPNKAKLQFIHKIPFFGGSQ